MLYVVFVVFTSVVLCLFDGVVLCFIFFLFISEKHILFCKSFFFAIRGLDPWVPHGSVFLSTTVKLALDTAEENKQIDTAPPYPGCCS